MGIRSTLARPFSAYINRQTRAWSSRPGHTQRRVLKRLIEEGKNTVFGRDHELGSVATREQFVKQVPIRDYEKLKPYIERVLQGEKNVLWTNKPIYWATTSGTTSGMKYIPITKDSLPNHIQGSRNALLNYVYQTKKSAFLDGGLIFLSGSPVLSDISGVKVGRLSGIANHHVPAYLRSNQWPSYATNCLEDWETKLDRIVDETLTQNMTLISGIPPWVQMYFDRIRARTGKKIKDVFPHFSVFVYGGVNYAPYRAQLQESIGKPIDSIELFPASEGFIAYQDVQHEEGLLLLLNAGIFFEFIPVEEYASKSPPRLTIEEVELDKNYALIINSNAGLWGYSIGDTVKFVSRNPYRLIVTGRLKHFLSAFGEHVIGEEVEKALQATCRQFPEVKITEFTVAPKVSSEQEQSCHEWFIEFSQNPHDQATFTSTLDNHMRTLNTYYDDLISGRILSPLKIRSLSPGTFIQYMKLQGKLGGQNKVPRLSNDRKIADQLIQIGERKE